MPFIIIVDGIHAIPWILYRVQVCILGNALPGIKLQFNVPQRCSARNGNVGEGPNKTGLILVKLCPECILKRSSGNLKSQRKVRNPGATRFPTSEVSNGLESPAMACRDKNKFF